MYKAIVELAKEERWEEILPTDNPALNEAVKLEEFALIEPIANNNYDLALRRAIFGRKWSIVCPLLPFVKNINAMSLNQKGQTALHFAARYGKDDVVTTLIQNGAYPNIFDTENYDTPLHLACEFSHPSTAKILVEFGALNLLNRKNKSPLNYCASFDNEGKAKFSEFMFLSIMKEKVKNALPPLPANCAWLNRAGVEKNPLVILSTSDETNPTVLNHPENKVFQIARNFMPKTLEIIMNHKIPNIAVRDLISLEKKYNAIFSFAITPMLHRDPKNCLLVNLSETELHNLYKLAEKIVSLEELLNVEFEVVFKTSSHEAYFIKSKTAVASETYEKFPRGSYSLSAAGELLIHSDKIDQLMESNHTMSQSKRAAGF